MSRLAENAERILDTARAAMENGGAAEVTILLGGRCGLRVTEGSEGRLDTLQVMNGAEFAYRVRRTTGGIAVEGIGAGEKCLFELSAKPRTRPPGHGLRPTVQLPLCIGPAPRLLGC